MFIITYTDEDNGMEISALTHSEFCAGDQELRDLVLANEWVWQDQDSKEAAIARHVEEHDAWASILAAGQPKDMTY